MDEDALAEIRVFIKSQEEFWGMTPPSRGKAMPTWAVYNLAQKYLGYMRQLLEEREPIDVVEQTEVAIDEGLIDTDHDKGE